MVDKTPEPFNLDLVENRYSLYLAYLRILMSYINDDGSVGPTNLSLSQTRRLTHQTISALLACGFSAESPVLQRSYTWLIESKDPHRTDDVYFYVVPDKIEAAIEMERHNDEFCCQAIDQLIERRRSPLDYSLPGETQSIFKALWVSKILYSHPERDRYIELIQETLKIAASNHLAFSLRDLSLLVSLYRNAIPGTKLSTTPLREMINLLRSGEPDGLLDASYELSTRIPNLRDQGPTPALTSGIRSELHWSLVGTCYVITNLAAFAERSQRIDRFLQNCVHNLYDILSHQPEKLSETFPKPYHQVMLAARALVAFTAYGKEDLPTTLMPMLIQELVKHEAVLKRHQVEQNKKRLQNVLQNWLSIDWNDEDCVRLAGGYTSASVLRVRPKLRIPSDDADGYTETSIPHLDSTIIKFGRKAGVDQERRNYSSIPPEYRHYFAAIPEKSHVEVIDNEVTEYLVIEDLLGYRTLQEIVPHCRPEFRQHLTTRLIDFLLALYAMPVIPRRTVSMVRHLYATPMFRSLETIHEYIQQFGELSEEDRDSVGLIEDITSKGDALESFPQTFMHGDLNIRNILVHGKQSETAEIRFRLIDLDELSRSGDLAFDIGEFVVDTWHVYHKYGLPSSVCEMSREVESKFCSDASERGDAMFRPRLDLAKARSLLKLAEIESKKALYGNGSPAFRQDAKSQFSLEFRPTLLRAYKLMEDVANIVNKSGQDNP